MKKFLVVALVLTVGVSFAFANSLKVPWFVDNAPANAGNPPTSGATGVVYLTNNGSEEVEVIIAYYNKYGQEVTTIPSAAAGAQPNTFLIAAKASIAFRPFMDDDDSGVGGNMEGGQGRLVPNRGTQIKASGEADAAKNGSIVLSWSTGDENTVQGAFSYFKSGSLGGAPVVVAYGHLLPPGVPGAAP